MSITVIEREAILHQITPGRSATKKFTIRKKGGILLPRHYIELDPDLKGAKAFDHPAVKEWWDWLFKDYKPSYSLALITPCSNVKPYTRSPTSRKIRGVFKRLGLWDIGADKPRGIEWLYFSDLLILVPYKHAEKYPACCYEVPPDLVLRDRELKEKVVALLSNAMITLVRKGLERVVVYLPRKHLKLWSEASKQAGLWPNEIRVKYSLFKVNHLEEAIVYTITEL